MYAHIEGVLADKSPDSLVIDANGVGYLLQVSGQTLALAPQVGERMKCHTVLSVREDALELFGFATREEKRMYEKLRAVSGIGPRTALQILSALSVRDLSVALVTGDALTLARAPGVGKKTAQRLVLELRDKIDNEEFIGSGAASLVVPRVQDAAAAEAVEALVALGYATSEAAKAVGRVAGQSDRSDELIRLALKGMGS